MFMKLYLLILCLSLVVFATTAQSQKSKPSAKSSTAKTSIAKKPTATARSTPKKDTPKLDDKAEFEKAIALEDAMAKVEALQKFVAAFPKSDLVQRANEALSRSALEVADENLAVGEAVTAIDMYRLGIASAPSPPPAGFFNDTVLKAPSMLFWRGNRTEAFEIAKSLEAKGGADAEVLAALAVFHASIESGDDAIRLAEAAVKADPAKSKAHAALGLALRVNFKLDESAAAYAKALEIEPTSIPIKRSLADLRRATGKADESVTLYREILAADEKDQSSRNGLVLSLFDAGKTEEAEKELARALEASPNNIMLIAGVAYWYAANKKGDRAVELAQKAISIEPRYIWSHIALGRGLMLQNRPLEAEEALLKAKAYGNFPTLDYELASARLMAGFYRDAVEGLQNSFSIAGNDVSTKIGARVSRSSASFTEVLADERRASILEPFAADDADTAARLKQLMIISAQLSAAKLDEAVITKAADSFVSGDDALKYHRQLYAASLLLNKKIAVDKALEYAEAAVGNADPAITVPNANSFVMASELYDSRQIAFTRGELVKVPEVPRQMLAAILRGRIEDLIGWALLQKDKPAEAAIRFRRAVAILPEKSAWWRAGMWRLGSALQADGKEQEALDAYIKSYSIDKPDLTRYTTVETLYKKINGSTEGLEAKIGAIPLGQISPVPIAAAPKSLPTEPIPNVAVPEPTPTPTVKTAETPVTPAEDTSKNAIPQPSAEKNAADPSLPLLKIEASPTPIRVAETTANPAVPAENVPASPSPSPKISETPAPEPSQTPVIENAIPQPIPSPRPEKKVETLEIKKPEPQPSETNVEQKNEASPPSVSATPSPTPEVRIEPAFAKSEPSSTTEIKIEPTVSRSEPPPSASVKPDEKSVAQTTTNSKVVEPKVENPKSKSAAKPLFEPIIITIPRSDAPKATTESKSEKPMLEVSRPDANSRPRVIVSEPILASEPSPCQISISQERLSLLNNGGTSSVLVGVDRTGDLADMKYVVSDPQAISATLESDVSDIRGRALYVIRSVSEQTGTFRVTFYLPCGRRDLAVMVR